jgi:hypothetical protein
MCPRRRSPMGQTGLSPFRRSQQTTLGRVITAIAERAHATSVAVAGPLAVELGPQLGRALTRFYRLLRTPRIDEQLLTAPLLQLLGGGQRLRLVPGGNHPIRRRGPTVETRCGQMDGGPVGGSAD